ncbi:MAG: fatty acid desaturase [Pseudomonadota bacterium]|nr:fatty acid desaturase [Pseudomonadota bacterium]
MIIIGSIWKYLRFVIVPYALLLSVPLFIWGGSALGWFTVSVFLVMVLADLFLGEDTKEYAGQYRYLGLFVWLESSAIVCFASVILAFAWSLGIRQGVDLFGVAALTHAFTGFDAATTHQNNPWSYYAAGFFLAGFSGGLVGSVVGHNMTHRTFNPVSVWIGRIGQAFSMFTYFSIRHPFGHHNLVGTPKDPSWARRGENYFTFRMRSVWGQYKMTWQLEKTRLHRMGYSVWSWRNQAIHGWLMEATVASVFIYAAGWLGLFAYLAIGFVSHSVLELVNYVEHYGLVRVPTEPFQYRHAWNDNHRMTLWVGMAITRHSHHHFDAQVEEYELKPLVNEAPTTPWGYFPSFFAALVPPIWHRVIVPKLLDWDQRFATSEERALAARENIRSGIPALVQAGQDYLNQRTGSDHTAGQPA